MQIYQLGSTSSTQTRFQFNSDTGFSLNKRTHSEAEKVYGVYVEEVFPETISPIEYAYAMVDEVQLLAVEFQYRRWYEITDTINGDIATGRDESSFGFDAASIVQGLGFESTAALKDYLRGQI